MREYNFIALGAGVQSTVMALMAAKGELLPKVDAAIFADTGAEPDEVYDQVDWLEEELPFPVYTVQHGNGLTKDLESAVKHGTRVAAPPLFTNEQDAPPIKRTCTFEYKIKPMVKKCRQLIGAKRGERIKDRHVYLWMGISLDEIERMKECRDKWMTHVFPLVDKRMRRGDCIEWMKRNHYQEPPRSACVYCPYHSNHEWRRLKDNDPDGWDEAVRVDNLIRNGITGSTADKLFVHRTMKPLPEVDLSTDVDKGQLTFLSECEGMCGI
jgi:hypothetical protein